MRMLLSIFVCLQIPNYLNRIKSIKVTSKHRKHIKLDIWSTMFEQSSVFRNRVGYDQTNVSLMQSDISK